MNPKQIYNSDNSDSDSNSDSNSNSNSDSDSDNDSKNNNMKTKSKNKKYNICYLRIGSENEMDILKEQEKYIKKKYSDFKIIKDIGSGFDFERKGFNVVFNLILDNKINKLMMFDKNSLLTSGYKFIKNLINVKKNGKLIILNNTNFNNTQSNNFYNDFNYILPFFKMV